MPQFTLKRALASTALIAAGMSAAMLPWRMSHQGIVLDVAALLFFWSSPALIFGGIGYLFKRAEEGASVGYVLFLLFAFLQH